MASSSIGHQEAYDLELQQHHLESRTNYTESRKSKTTINAVEVREIDEKNHDDTPESRYWNPGVMARFPWVGCGALILMLACIAFQVVILTSSNGKVKEKWPVEIKWHFIERHGWREKAQLSPNVALAVTNTVSNLCL
jgi:hypothetical protein